MPPLLPPEKNIEEEERQDALDLARQIWKPPPGMTPKHGF
jgi:hypothetical protein